ncbi:MAG: cyclodeaminase/cyclohydrolase family protein [Negativicutes bacterium]|jgi:formiminotetrahydrofolate cyclodeaminase
MFEQYTLKQLGDELASNSPTPGGGTAAAMSAMFGAALVEMVVNLSLDKAELIEYKPTLVEALSHLTALRQELAVQMDKDAAAFDAVMAAFKLPKSTDEEKINRTAAIRLAFYEAAMTPLMTATQACAVLELAAGLLGKINENAASDLLTGAELCYAGFRGAAANVAINLPSVKDEIKTEFLTFELTRLKTFAADFVKTVRDSFHEQPMFAIIKE